MRQVRVGIIGFGLSGSVFHAPLIHHLEEFVLAKVVSSDAEKVKSKYPHVEVVSDVDSLLADDQIELVVICSPNLTHGLYAKAALMANKHVIVEKPFVIHHEEGLELIDIAKEKNRVLSVYQNRRWDNDFLTVTKFLETGALGEVHSYESHFDRYRPSVIGRWREQNLDGSGTLYDLGSHLIDQAIQLFGRPHTVTADLSTQRVAAQAIDYFDISLGYGHLKVMLRSGSLVKRPGPRFIIHGHQGSFIKYGLDPQENDLKAGKLPSDPAWGLDDEQLYAQIEVEFSQGLTWRGALESARGAYEAYYLGMYEAIVNHQDAPVLPMEAVETIKVIEYALKSHQEQRTLEFI